MFMFSKESNRDVTYHLCERIFGAPFTGIRLLLNARRRKHILRPTVWIHRAVRRIVECDLLFENIASSRGPEMIIYGVYNKPPSL
jgi:hypothetical protein